MQPYTSNTGIYDNIEHYASLERHIRHCTALHQSKQPYTNLYSPIAFYNALYDTIEPYISQ